MSNGVTYTQVQKPPREVDFESELLSPGISEHAALERLAAGMWPDDATELSDFVMECNSLLSALRLAARDPSSGVDRDQVRALKERMQAKFPASSEL